MTSLKPALSPSRGIAEWLWYAAGFVLASMPVAMAVAHRSSSLFISLAAAAALTATALEGGTQRLAANALSALKTPLGIATLAFLGFAALSITWSVAPLSSLTVLVEFALTLAAAFALAVALPGRVPHDRTPLLALAVALACLLIAINLWTDGAARRALGLRAELFIFNRPALAVLVTSIPLVFLLHRSRKVVLAGALTVLVAGTVLASESGAAALGALAAAAAYGTARLSRRLAVGLVGAGIVAAIVLAPLSGAILDRVLPRAVHETIRSTNSQARIDIWKAFGLAIWQEPLAGSGYGVSPRFPETPAARRVALENPGMFALWHPHNAALQIWVELGAIGAILAVAIVALVLRELQRLRPDRLPSALALLAAVAGVSLVGHGAWQGWWPATIGTAIVWFRCGEREFTGPRR